MMMYGATKMRKISLVGKYGKGKFALIDEDDFVRVSNKSWFLNDQGYALWANGKKNIRLHRFILDYYGDKDIDHINRDKLDNRKSNLRIVDRSTNNFNAKVRVDNTSGYKGVHFFKPAQLWRAYIGGTKKRVELGYFKTKEEAIEARKKAEVGLCV